MNQHQLSSWRQNLCVESQLCKPKSSTAQLGAMVYISQCGTTVLSGTDHSHLGSELIFQARWWFAELTLLLSAWAPLPLNQALQVKFFSAFCSVPSFNWSDEAHPDWESNLLYSEGNQIWNSSRKHLTDTPWKQCLAKYLGTSTPRQTDT